MANTYWGNQLKMGGGPRPMASADLMAQFNAADNAGKAQMLTRGLRTPDGQDQYTAIRRAVQAANPGMTTNQFQSGLTQLTAQGAANPFAGGSLPSFAGSMTPSGAGAGTPPAMVAGGGAGGAGVTGVGAPTLAQLATGSAASPQQGAMGSPGYGVNVSDYLDPSMKFQMDEAQRVLENSAAARGSLNSGQTMRDLTSLATNMARTDYNNAFNRAANTRDFTYGVDSADRLFDYNASNADRAFDYGRLRDLANMGLSGTSTATSGENQLAGILAGLMGNQGQIQASGTIGGSNTVNNTISQIIANMMQNSMLANLGA